jgi:outer membrane protein OmpA-like peptidoglycan-associated protein
MALNLEASLTDLMTSLAIVFIMLMLALAQNQGQGSRNALQEIQTKINAALESQALTCESDTNNPLSCVIRLPEDRLRFHVNRADIDPQGKAFIHSVFPSILTVLEAKDIQPSVESVYIQGFTDSDGNDEENLYLSQQRAFSVGRYVVSDVVPPSKARNDLLEWLYVSGRGEQELIMDDVHKATENKAASRRVEVRIQVKSSEQRNSIASRQDP